MLGKVRQDGVTKVPSAPSPRRNVREREERIMRAFWGLIDFRMNL